MKHYYCPVKKWAYGWSSLFFCEASHANSQPSSPEKCFFDTFNHLSRLYQAYLESLYRSYQKVALKIGLKWFDWLMIGFYLSVIWISN